MTGGARGEGNFEKKKKGKGGGWAEMGKEGGGERGKGFPFLQF
jgi:hypothetical protein